MIKKKVIRMLSIVTVVSVGILGSGLANAGDVDTLVEKADDLIEHADAAIEASDGIVESLDAIVEEIDALVEGAIADFGKSGVAEDFTYEAMNHADELTEAADGIAEANVALLQEVYDVLLDSDAKVDAALMLFDGAEKGVAKKARLALTSADGLLKAALGTVCATFVDDAEAPCLPREEAYPELPCLSVGGSDVNTVNEPMGAIEIAMAADAFVECADAAIEKSIANDNPLGDEANPAENTLHGADAAIEAADKAVEKADRLIEAARL